MSIEQYKVGDKIGGELSVLKVFGGKDKSGMGVVYLVQDRETTFPYVLKTFQYRPGTEAATRFISEARAWIEAGVHANIVRAFWVREIDSQLFIAAEYIEMDEEGRNTVTSYIKDVKLKNEIILNWAAQFCYGMSYVTEKGILCHRDIKPDNLMITLNGILKVTDLGLAKSVARDESMISEKSKLGSSGECETNDFKTRSITQTGAVLGTPLYMAPEQFINSKKIDKRADIYSFGIVLYQMLTAGKYPYALSKKISKNPILEFAEIHMRRKLIAIESPLMPIISKCLKKRRGDRYASYDDFLISIKKIAKNQSIKIAPPPIVGDMEDEELYTKAQAYIALKEPQKALSAIDAYVSKFPDHFWGWTEKSRIHLYMNEPEVAVKAARKSLSLNPYNTHALNNLGLAYSRQGLELNRAKQALKAAIDFDPQNTGAMANLSILLLDMAEYDQIPNLLAQALQLRPEKETLCFNAGNIAVSLIEKNKLEEAKIILNALTKASPNHLNAWHNLALIHWQKGQLKEAIKCFKNVVRINPEDDFAWLSLAKIYFRSKNAKLTVDCCNRLISMGKSVSAAVAMVAQVINFTGNYWGSVEFIERHLKQQPYNDAWWFILSEIHEYRENYQAALFAAKKCKEILLNDSNISISDNFQLVEERIRRLKMFE